MNNEYITKAQAIDLAKSLRPIAGKAVTDAFIRGIEKAEAPQQNGTREIQGTPARTE